MYGFDGNQIGIYFGGEPIKRTEVEVGMGKLKNGILQLRMRSLERW